jgi:hypothetical protein
VGRTSGRKRDAAEQSNANVIAVRAADKDKPWVNIPAESYQTPEICDFVLTKFKGAVLPAWQWERRRSSRPPDQIRAIGIGEVVSQFGEEFVRGWPRAVTGRDIDVARSADIAEL